MMLVGSHFGGGASKIRLETEQWVELSDWASLAGRQQECSAWLRVRISWGDLEPPDTCARCKTTKSDLWGWDPALVIFKAPPLISVCTQH